jgi:hypothetical protein
MRMDYRPIRDKAARRSRIILNELTPKERKALIVIVILVIMGAVAKILRDG